MRMRRRVFGTKDVASCMKVMRVLQSYLDGTTDEVTTRRVARHLEMCRRCGLEAATYAEIKRALTRKGDAVDSGALDRLERFARSLDESGHADASGDPSA